LRVGYEKKTSEKKKFCEIRNKKKLEIILTGYQKTEPPPPNVKL